MNEPSLHSSSRPPRQNSYSNTKIVLLTFGGFFVLISLGIWVLTALIKTSPTTTNTTNQNQPNLPVLTSTQDVPAPLPAYRIVHEDYRNPIPFVVASGSSDLEIKNLLKKIRDSVRSHSFTDLGLQPANIKNRYNTSGMIEVFRGVKCASEAYTDGPLPCGDGEHYAGFYQWGLGGVFTDDAGGFRQLSNDFMVSVFSSTDGYTLPPALQQKVEAEAKAIEIKEKADDADRRMAATAMENNLRQAGFDINVLAGPDSRELIMESSIFENDLGRVNFLSRVMPKLKASLCKIGFTRVKLQSGMFSLSDPYQIGCPN